MIFNMKSNGRILLKRGREIHGRPLSVTPPLTLHVSDSRTCIEDMRIKEDEKKQLIQEGRYRMFNMSLKKQDCEHEWNLEEYEKNCNVVLYGIHKLAELYIKQKKKIIIFWTFII